MKLKRFCLAALLVLLVAGSDHLQVPAAADTYPSIPSGSQSCTSFGLTNNGYLVFGANLDLWLYKGLLFVNKRNVSKMAWEPGTTGEYAAWVSQYGSVTFNLVGYQLVWAGMNEMGLVVSTMSLDETQSPAPDARPPLESPFWLQYLLDNFSTVEEVIASDAQVRIENTQDHYLVCDRTGTCAVIEFLDGKMAAHTGDDLPVSALTNNTYEESVAAWQAASQDGAPKPGDDSLRRFYTAAERVISFESNGTESAVDYAFKTLDLVSRGETQWSIVFDTENQRVYFKTKMHPQIRYVDLSTFDFSCLTPVLMLDVQENLSGDISSNFVGYLHEVSLAHTLEFARGWRSQREISPEQVEGVLALAESFACGESTP
jgi:penicillin V acylase-like amidase (Ntn superfamily)